MPGFLKNNLEKGLFLAFAVLLTLFVLSGDTFRPEPLPPLRSQGEMPPPPELVPWHLSDFLVADKSHSKSLGDASLRDPFRVVLSFPPESAPPVTKSEPPPEPAPVPLPPPKPHTTTVISNGFFTSLSGKKYIMLELDDSRDGRCSVTSSEGDELFSGFFIKKIANDYTVISTPENGDITIPWDGSHTFQRKSKK